MSLPDNPLQEAVERRVSEAYTKGYGDGMRAVEAYAGQLHAALEKAYRELNEIHARDGVPYTRDGWKSSVDQEYFTSVVEGCRAALAKNPNPSGQRTTEASPLLSGEASGPVGLGPVEPLTGQIPTPLTDAVVAEVKSMARDFAQRAKDAGKTSAEQWEAGVDGAFEALLKLARHAQAMERAVAPRVVNKQDWFPLLYRFIVEPLARWERTNGTAAAPFTDEERAQLLEIVTNAAVHVPFRQIAAPEENKHD